MKKYIEENSFEKIKKQIKENLRPPKRGQPKEAPKAEIIFSSNDDKLNRKVLEKLEVDVLLLKQSKRKDFQKQRNSGLNQVLSKIAKKKNITIGIDLDEIINSKGKQKSEILARVKQNIKLCNKNKLKMKFCGGEKRNLYDLKAFGLVLGMPTWMAKGL